MSTQTLDEHRARYALIHRYQQQALALFKASLAGDADPEIARMVVSDLPEHWGIAYHQALTEQQHRVPVFFRTDEMLGGKITEIQCSGSGWGLTEQLRNLYDANPAQFGSVQHFQQSLASHFSSALRDYVGCDPIVHHLVDNASRPHGINYFIHSLRDHGVPHLFYDGEIHPSDCNFVRAHDFISLPTHNFFADRIERCNNDEVFFDLPPSCLFDGKLIMAWPFWEKTRDAFDDELRDLFPHTAVIEPAGVVLNDGQQVTLDDFCALPRTKRDYYIKYAGTDVAINWGSKAVFLGSTLSQKKCGELMDRIMTDYDNGRYWIIQEAVRHSDTVEVLGRDGSLHGTDAYSKLSGFYGPAGLMAILVMQLRSHKVHGSADTILSIAY